MTPLVLGNTPLPVKWAGIEILWAPNCGEYTIAVFLSAIPR
jgi:hypothetical protein